ncbi:MAG: TonB-dependent receptor [Verrucomicrobiota bacterium]
MNRLLLLSGLALAPALFAAEAKTTAETKPADDTIRLTEFTVTAEEDRGYAASETLSGSRVATKIIDLPYTVNVLTSEFFADFAIFDLNDTLTQIGSFTGLSGGGGFTLRGFSSSSQLRDGFYRIGRFGTSNVDRIEIIKGSNAAIYGRTSPGGMVNMISKAPRSTPGYKFTFNAGSYSTLRGVFEATGPVVTTSLGKTSFLLASSQGDRSYDVAFARTRNLEHYLALKHQFKDGSALTVSAEYFLQVIHSPPGSAPIVIDQKGTSTANDDVAVGYAENLANYNPYGPHSESTRGNPSFSAIYEKKFNPIWSLRLGANYYRARSWKANDNTGFGSININPANAATPITSTRGNPVKQLYSEDGGCFQADLLAHTWLFNKQVESRSLATIDLNDYYRWDPNWTYATTTEPVLAAWNATGSGRIVTLNKNLEPVAPLTYFPNDWVWGHEVPGQARKGRISVLGGLLRQQAGFFNSRLLAFAGARFDAVRFRHRDFLTAVTTFNQFPQYANYQKGDQIRRLETALKPNVGVNYRLVSNLRVFANYSESYFVNQGDGPALLAEPNYAPEVATGYDYGFKGALLDERLTFTVSGFYATRTNVSVTEVIESPVGSGKFTTATRRDGDQLVRGFEIDLNWRIGQSVSLNGSWGHVYSIYTNFGSAKPMSVGRRVNNVSPENGSLSLRYSPRDGWLRGFSTNVGITRVTRTPTEAPNAGDTYTTTTAGVRVLSRTTRQWALTVPGFDLWNAALRYTTRSNPRTNQQLAFNVNNVFDRDYLKVGKQKGDRRAFFVSYSFGLGSLRN